MVLAPLRYASQHSWSDGLWVIGYREGMKGYWLLGEEKKRGEDGRGVKKNAYFCSVNIK